MASRLTCASTDSGRVRYAYCMPNSNQFCERLCGSVTLERHWKETMCMDAAPH
jgi:hypothetical protein